VGAVNCPKCDFEQPAGANECARCGLVFAKWREPPVAGVYSGPPPESFASQPATSTRRGSGSSIVRIAGFLAVAAGWYWFIFWTPSGLPSTADAYQDTAHGFAVVPPDGWHVKKMGACDAAASALISGKPCVVAELLRDADRGAGGPNVQVAVAPVSSVFKTGWGGSVALTESDKEGIGEGFDEGIAKAIPGYTSEEHGIISVDNLGALHARGSATITGTPTMVGDSVIMIPDVLGSTPERHITAGGVLVPTGREVFLIIYGCDTADYGQVRDAIDSIVGSFRITANRPTPFQAAGGLMGSIKGDAILGLLVGLTMAMLKLVTA
jgi:hypothetical protein